MMLPDAKLVDKPLAIESVKRLAALDQVSAVLVGDGWQVFQDGHQLLKNIFSPLEKSVYEV